MPEPIVFITKFRIKDGLLEDFRKLYQDSIPKTLLNKPGTHVQLGFFNEDWTEFVIVRVFPDAAAMGEQLSGSDERSKESYKFIEPTQIEIYGLPNNDALEMITKVSGTGIRLSIMPHYAGGFIRQELR